MEADIGLVCVDRRHVAGRRAEDQCRFPVSLLPILSMKNIHYPLAVFFFLGCFGMATLLATLVVDPYGVSPIGVNISGFNRIRTERLNSDRLVKPIDVLLTEAAATDDQHIEVAADRCSL